MRITFDRAKRERTLQERGLDFRQAKNISAGKLNGRFVIIVWTPRGKARRIISMRKANEREIKRLAPYLA